MNFPHNQMPNEEFDRASATLAQAAATITGGRESEIESIFRSGDMLLATKASLASQKGAFGKWLKDTCRMSSGTANNNIHAAQRVNVADRPAVVARFDKGALFEFTKPRTSDAVLAAAIAMAKAGEHVTVGVFNNLLGEHAKVERAAGAVVLPKQVRIEHCDFRELDIEPGSIDLLLCDPPYDEASVPLYGMIAERAAVWLRPGAWCLVYAGKMYQGRITKLMKDHLDWGWCFDVVHAKPMKVKTLQIDQHGKYVLGFRRRSERPVRPWWDRLSDRLEFPAEKKLHPWQQPVAEAAYLIEHLCPVGGVVCDPCLGTGTTAVAALQLGRQFVGCDRDEQMIRIARERVAKEVG